MKYSNKGFTLIELLVVIAIIAVLSTVVVLYLNPAEFLRRARDSNRLSDMGALKNAILMYQRDALPSVMGTAGICYIGSNVGTSTAACREYFSTATDVASSSSRVLNGTGWIPIDFGVIVSGMPLDQLPMDPSGPNDPNHFYSYISDGSSGFKLAAKMESALYSFGGDGDKVSGDNGFSTSTFEDGSALGL